MPKTPPTFLFILLSALLHAGLYLLWQSLPRDDSAANQASGTSFAMLSSVFQAKRSMQTLNDLDHEHLDGDMVYAASDIVDPPVPEIQSFSGSKPALQRKPHPAQTPVKVVQKKPVPKAVVTAEVVKKTSSKVSITTSPARQAAVDTRADTVPVRIAGKTRGPVTTETRDLTPLVSALRTAVDRNKRYPRVARRKGYQGTSEVAFQLFPDGRINDIRISETSRYRHLDRAAVKAVASINPFPIASRYLDKGTRFRLKVAFVLD